MTYKKYEDEETKMLNKGEIKRHLKIDVMKTEVLTIMVGSLYYFTKFVSGRWGI